MAGSLNLHPNREHLLSLMDAARDICAAFGTPETTFEPVGYGVDASEIRHDNYFLKSEKITLKVRRSSGFSYDSLSVEVTLSQLEATVFSAYWNKQEETGSLNTYRPGKWENYLLGQQVQAKAILRRRRELNQQRQAELKRAREEAERQRFDPIDDSDYF